MAFGPIMRLTVGELDIELAPLTKESMEAYLPGIQKKSTFQYLSLTTALVLEDEQDWFEIVRKAINSILWGIWVLEGDGRKLIGSTSLGDITIKHTHQAVSGSLIFDQSYWGKGIASAIHKARTWYAFQHMGLTRIKSAVLHGNVASRKALEKSGYTFVYLERNEKFIDGQLRHLDNLECINPSEAAWRLWWGTDRPTKAAYVARQRTLDVMAWAEQNVTLL